MKIGFFSDTYLPVSFGTEISMEIFRTYLEKIGHQVFIFAPKYSEAKKSEGRIFRFPAIRLLKSPDNRLMLFRLKDIKKITDLKLDIVHAHTPFSAGWLAKIVAQKLKIPLFYSSHILYPDYAKYWLIKGNKILPSLMKLYLKIYGNSCSALIAPSEKMKKLLESYGIKKPIFVLPTGLDFEKLKISQEKVEIRKKFNLPEEEKILLYVGRLTEEKNIRFLFESFVEICKKRKGVSFILIGEGKLMEEIKEKVKKMGLSSKIILTGRIPWQEVVEFYRQSYLFLFASLTDTQGLVLMEASYFGLPIVALKDECYKGILINEKNGYTVYPYQVSLFVEKVLKLLDNQDLYQKFSKNAQKIARTFSAENQAKKLLDIYQQVIKLQKQA